MIAAMGIPVTMATKKMGEGHPNVVDVVNDGSVGAVINNPVGRHIGLARRVFHTPRRRGTANPLLYFLGHSTAAVESLLVERGSYNVRRTEEYRMGGF